jgi:hypothetical protein
MDGYGSLETLMEDSQEERRAAGSPCSPPPPWLCWQNKRK